MHAPSPRRPLPLRWLGLFTLLFLVVTVGGWSSGPSSAQAPARKPPKEEEEDPNAPKRKAPPPVDDEELPPTKPGKGTPRKAAAPGQPELVAEAERSTNPQVRDLFQSLAVAHDVVAMPSGTTVFVEPVPLFVGQSSPRFSGKLNLQTLNKETWKQTVRFQPGSSDILGITPYEQLTLQRVDEFLKKVRQEHGGAAPETARARYELLEAARKVLSHVVNFHLGARTSGLRDESPGWQELEKRLHDKLKEVQLDQLRALADAQDWEEALLLAMQLAETYAGDEQVKAQVAQMLGKHVEQSAGSMKYTALQVRKVLEQKFPTSPENRKLQELLSSQAKKLFQEATNLEKTDRQAALAKLKAATELFPRLPGLEDYRLKLENAYPILYVGVRELPQNLSPATAFTDAEKQAVELLFEALVELTVDPLTGPRYEPELALGQPRLVPCGRVFELTRHAYWHGSGERRVTAADIGFTRNLLSDKDWPGRTPAWVRLLQDVHVEGDPFHVHLSLSQGYFDPLSLMTFKILPRLPHLTRPDDPKFAAQPIGSGPFQLKERTRDAVVFVANPHYRERPGKEQLPRIREIRFIQSANPVLDFQNNQLHLLLDLPTARYKELKSANPNVDLFTLPNRRVYFLAVNHRSKALGSNTELRRAIGHAIDRTAILNTCFRSDLPEAPHRPLNGPYPPESWAYNPQVTPDGPAKGDPFKPDLAKALAEKARGGEIKSAFRLVYPDDDDTVKRACEQIREQVKKNAGIELLLDPVPPKVLRERVESSHDYELAYYHHDYANEAYWLWPLFDPEATGPGGQNYLGYRNDAELESCLRQAMVHRQFAEVQQAAHTAHRIVHDKMPLIPLWQLDSHFAVHRNLKLPRYRTNQKPALDPLRVFTQAEEWRLENPPKR